jgi:hypothetical protein
MTLALSQSWLEVCPTPTFVFLEANLIIEQIEQALGQRPQFSGDALAMREQYKALANQINASNKRSASLNIGTCHLIKCDSIALFLKY